MRVFLSPLFFRRHFCGHCVRIFYKQNPENWIWQHELTHMPPLGMFQPREGFVPDYSVLTMFDEFVIDWEAHDRILSPSSPSWLGSWADVLQVLGAEGSLSLVETDRESKKVAHLRGSMLRRDMVEPTRWANAMRYYDNLMAGADRALGNQVDAAGKLTWTFNPSSDPGVRGVDGEYHMLSGLPLLDPGKDPDDPHYKLREHALAELRAQLREVNAGLALTKVLDAAPMFWAPYSRYLEEKSIDGGLANRARKKAQAANLFFSVAFPQYRPETANEFKRLRKDKRLRQLRTEIEDASKSGDVLDPHYPQRVLGQVLRVERKVGRARQISGWISSAINSVPLPGVSLASAALTELVSSSVERRLRRPWNWFYLISDGTGYS